MKNPLQILHLLGMTGLASLSLGCGGKSSSGKQGPNLAIEASGFLGLSSIEKQGADAWVLSWNPIDFPGAIYAIYRAREGDSFNFAEPLTTTQASSFRYKSENVLSEPSQCFLVRIQGAANSNLKSLCNDNKPSIFQGIEKIERQGDGTYVLHWTKLPVDDATYNVFERANEEQYDEAHPSYSVSTDFLQTSLFPRGEEHCFTVRVSHKDYGADGNSSELCSTKEDPINFSESANAISVSSPDRPQGTATGSIVAQWLLSTTADVAGYRILNNFSEPMRCREANAQGLVTGNTCTIEGLIPGEQRYLSVKAVDAFGRESGNYVTFPVIVK